MGTLSDRILSADDLPKEQVKTDEWAPAGVPFVVIRSLTSAERDEWELAQTIVMNGKRVANPNLKNVRAALAAKIIVEESTGERAFTDKQATALGAKSPRVLDRIFNAGMKLSGIVADEDEGNPSTGDQEDMPSSDSPSPSE